MRKLNVMIPVSVVMAAFVLFAFTIPQEQKKAGPWEIPAKYQKMTNPIKDDAASVNTGKMLWGKYCKSCHGNIGKGDGPKAAQLKTFPGDFTTEAFKKGTDGELYYKSIIGRDEMPNFESKIPDENDRWAIVNYIRTLK